MTGYTCASCGTYVNANTAAHMCATRPFPQPFPVSYPVSAGSPFTVSAFDARAAAALERIAAALEKLAGK